MLPPQVPSLPPEVSAHCLDWEEAEADLNMQRREDRAAIARANGQLYDTTQHTPLSAQAVGYLGGSCGNQVYCWGPRVVLAVV